MANEFKVKNGLIVDQGGANITGSSEITGSLVVSGSVNAFSFTGSLFGTASWAQSASVAISSSYALSSSYAFSSSYAQTSSYAVNLFVSQSISSVDYIDFDTNYPYILSASRLGWDSGENTLQLGLAGGNVQYSVGEQMYQYVYNAEGSTLTKGQVVYISGSQGNSIAVKLASATNEQGSAGTLGLVAETIAAGANGWIITEGTLRQVNTLGYTAGAQIYLGVTPGTFTETIPQAPSHSVRLGNIERVNATVGSIYVKIDNGYELDELHNVLIVSESAGDLLVRSGSVWTNSKQLTGSYGLTGSLTSINGGFTGSLFGTASYAENTPPPFIDNYVTVGLPGSETQYNSIKAAVDSITDASSTNTYTVKVYPGVYIEDTITMKSWIAVKGDSSISTVVSASNPSASIFVMADQTMVIDMQIQGATAPGVAAVYYSSPTTPQTNAIAYVENVRFGTNYTNATCEGSGSGNCILQCSNVKYGGFTDSSLQSFVIGFYVTGNGSNIGRMQLRNVTSTNGGVAGTDNNQIFALSDAPGCTFIVNGCLLTRATGTARGTAFKVYNGGQLRLTAVNFQRWINGIWAPQTGSAPSIDAVALNFENCTTDVLVEHTGSIGKVSGTDSFLKTQIALEAPLYEVGQDPRKIIVAKKGGDFTSISASVAYITGSSINNRYVIEVGPGQFIEKQIDLSNKPYVAIVGSDIQTTQIIPSGSGNYDQIVLGPTNEVSFLTLTGNEVAGYAALRCQDLGEDFAQAHKVSIYDFDYGIKVLSSVSSSTFYGEYVDINGPFTYGVYVSSSNSISAVASMENYYLFPSGGISTGNFAVGSGAQVDLYTCLFVGDNVSGSTAIKLQDGAIIEGAGLDMQDWEIGLQVPNVGVPPRFRLVGTMIHNTITYDFEVLKTATQGRYQGIADHSKISNASEDFYWNFLDDNDGENDVTRKLSVTFADGTHTDATTLIFKGSPMGVMSGGVISLSSGLTITTSAGFGYCENPLDDEVYKRIDWNNTNITLAANTNNYIYLNYNGILSASGTAPNSAQNIILGRVVTNDTTVEFIDQSPYNASHMSNGLSLFNRDALGPVFAEGSIVTEGVTPFTLDVTQGSYFFSENNFLPSGTSSINLNQYYLSGSGWNISTSSIVPNNVYTSGSALVPMSASYYTKHTTYLVGEGVDEEYFLVINNNQYSTLVEAEDADLPIIPFYFNDGVVPLAAVYVQSGSANITQIQDIRPIIGFRAAGVNASSVHGNLLGLTADDHLQYLLVDGGREMAGDLGLGGNDLYNIASVSASLILANQAQITSITGSLLGNVYGTSSWSETSSFTTSASFANSSSLAVSSSFATSASYATSSSFAISSSRAVTSSFAISASYAVSASYSITASNALLASSSLSASVAVSASFATTASNALLASSSLSASIATSASFSTTASFALSSSLTVSSSFATSASYATSSGFAVSSSYASSSLSSSFAISSSRAVTSSFAVSASYAISSSYAITASNSLLASSSLSASVATSASYATASGFAVSSSYASSSLSSSFAVSSSRAVTSSFAITSSNTISSSFASTASSVNTLNQNVTLSGSLLFSGTNNGAYSIQTTNNSLILEGAAGGSALAAGQLRITANTNAWTDNVTSSYFQIKTTGSFGSNNYATFQGGTFGADAPFDRLQFASYYTSFINGVYGSTPVPLHVVEIINTNTSVPALGIRGASGQIANYINVQASGSATGSLFSITRDGTVLINTTASSTESNLFLGGLGADEGGQLTLQSGLSYTSGAMLDNYQDRLRILRGNNTSSNAEVAFWNLTTRQMVLSAYTGSGVFPGTAVANLAVDSLGNVITVTPGTVTSASFASTASYVNPLSQSVVISGSLTVTGSINATSFTGSHFGSSSYALTASNAITSSFAITASNALLASSSLSASVAISASYAATASVGVNFTASNLLVNGTITAQTLVVNTVSSSVVYSSGSNIFGNSLTNTQQFTGSVSMTGSLTVVGAGITGSLFGSSSYASASGFAISSSYASSSLSSSFAISSSRAVTSSFAVSASNAISASYSITSSFAVSASYAPAALSSKAGSVANTSFAGNPRKATVTFSTAFANTNYAVVITGEDARSWTVESKAVGSFVINANSNTSLGGTTYWIATSYGETS